MWVWQLDNLVNLGGKMCSPHFPKGQLTRSFLITLQYVFPKDLLEVCVSRLAWVQG